MKTSNKVIKKIVDQYKTIWSLDYCNGILGWDLATYMPRAANQNHATAMGKLAVMYQEKLLDKNFLKLIDHADKQKNLTDQEKAIVKKLKRERDQNLKLPKDFIEKWSITTANAQSAWENAKAEEDYNLFKPHLKKVINLNLQKAGYLGYKKHPLDALLDQFEEGLTQEQVDNYFNEIRPFLVDLLTYIKASKKYNATNPLQKLPYNREFAEKLNYKVLQLFDQTDQTLRLGTSAHPFTCGFSSNQARITTWYHKNDINRTLAATIHEYGHALYELQTSPELDYTPISGGSSLGIHESQSRFWENFIGRNKTFINQILPDINKALSKKVSAKDYYIYANSVKPSLIRVEADEVTYHFHILIRYEMEKGFLDKTINVDTAVEAWNEKYQNYLGIKPKKLSEGILQDIHWGMGAIGYFPTYSTGTVLSAVWKELLEEDLGTIKTLIKTKKGIQKIKKWQQNHIHKYGSTYSFNEIIQKNTKKEFTTEPWKNYLDKKYREIY
jgi:carboxypeptidase Taq